MKLLFHIILIYFFVYVNSQVPPGSTVNGCGMVGYNEPQSVEDCKDDSEICCYISLKIDEGTKKFCSWERPLRSATSVRCHPATAQKSSDRIAL